MAMVRQPTELIIEENRLKCTDIYFIKYQH